MFRPEIVMLALLLAQIEPAAASIPDLDGSLVGNPVGPAARLLACRLVHHCERRLALAWRRLRRAASARQAFGARPSA